MLQVSVIVLTYNPDNEKLHRTLLAAAAQKDIDFEILISDDGSANADFSFLEQLGLPNCRLLAHPQNQGTVKNCLSALREAAGEYVFLTSAGDYLYDEHTLADFYKFASQNNALLCFGNAVYYCASGDTARLTRSHTTPYCPQMFTCKTPGSKVKTHFYGDNWVIGAAYFRHRETALKYFEQIADVSVYVEDNTSTAFALADGIPLCHYDRNIVWYEDGTGVSTGASEKWRARIAQDVQKSYALLKTNHPKDPFVDFAFHNTTETNRKKRILYKLLHHPLITARLLWAKRFAKKTPVVCTKDDLERLNRLCSMKE